MTDVKERLIKLDKEVTRYTRSYPKNFRKGKLLKDIEDGMKSLLKDIKEKDDGDEYNRLIGRLTDWYSDPKFLETYTKKKPRLPDVPKYEREDDTPITDTFTPEPETEGDTPEPETEADTPLLETEGDITDNLLDLDTPREEEEMKEEEMKEEKEEEKLEKEKKEMKEEVKKEEKLEEEISPEMEEIHNQIRKDERERVMKEFNLVDPTIGTIDIPKERLGIEGKTIKILNDDIKYFINRFPDMLKMEASVYKKTNKKNKKALQDLHRRIQAKLSPDPKKEEGEKVGIILDADKFIDMKITELLATKTLEGLTPANLVDITEEPKSQGRDVGSYTLTRKGGRDIISNAPVYRSIPTTQPQQSKRKGEIKQSTIYENSGKTKVDIAKMELNNNPFIRQQKPKRLNIIL